MSGILDSKSRVIDTVVTLEGRRQLSQGGLDIKFVTFTDGATFYKADIASGSQDATQRLYLEACQLPQDAITFQADDQGNLQTFPNGPGVPLAAGRILDYSFQAASSSILSGASQGVSNLQGSAFAAAAGTILASSADNFSKLYAIATQDPVFEDDGFGMGPNQVTFTISDGRPISDPSQYATHINALDSLFADPRFSHQANFKYLPPCNKITDASVKKGDPRELRPYFLGYYRPWGRTHIDKLTYHQVMTELQYYQSLGYMQTVNFDPTSLNNVLVGQFFESSNDTLKKLDVIDFGIHQTNNASSPTAHVFFVGKVEVDEKGTDTFLHIFTLVFQA